MTIYRLPPPSTSVCPTGHLPAVVLHSAAGRRLACIRCGVTLPSSPDATRALPARSVPQPPSSASGGAASLRGWPALGWLAGVTAAACAGCSWWAVLVVGALGAVLALQLFAIRQTLRRERRPARDSHGLAVAVHLLPSTGGSATDRRDR